MFERTTDASDRTNQEASSNAAYQSLFADAYEFRGSAAGRSKQSGPSPATGGEATQVIPPKDGYSQTQAAGEVGNEDEGGNYDEFPFEMIFRDSAPTEHTIAEGETLEALARAHLGADASEDEVRAHVQEIQEFNGGQVATGQQVVLPGHTADGDVVLPLKDGTTYTISGDPVVRAQQQAAAEQQYRKPPLATLQPLPSGQPDWQTDPNQGCFPARVDWTVYDRHGRPIGGEHYTYMRCPPDFRRQ